MRMGPLEKLIVNNPLHSYEVARHATSMLRHAQPVAGQRYLEVGCGNGAAPRRIARVHQLDVTGVDVDPAQVRTARRRCHGQDNIRFVTVDGTQLPFADADFDIVATHRATHHIPKWEHAVAEMLRVLKPGGYFVYSDLLLPGLAAAVGRLVSFTRGFPTARALAAVAAGYGLVRVHRLHLLLHYQAVWHKPSPTARADDQDARLAGPRRRGARTGPVMCHPTLWTPSPAAARPAGLG